MSVQETASSQRKRNENQLLIDGGESAKVTVLFAHGAGADMQHEFMFDIANQLSDYGVRVIRFNFPYMIKRAEQGKKYPPDRASKLLIAFEQQIEHFGYDSDYLFLAGKSMGGRMASHLADHQAVSGVICLGFPFHPPKKPENFRGEHLMQINTPTLILQGERDTFGTKQECEHFHFAPSVSIEFIPDGDHGFKPRVRSGFTELGNRKLAVEKMYNFISQHTSR